MVRELTRHWLRALKLAVPVSTLLCPLPSSADSNYQFLIDLDAARVEIKDFNEDGTGDIYSLRVEAYMEPVQLNGLVPYERAAFYGRQASISLDASKADYSDLSIILGPRLLKEYDTHAKHVGIHLAKDDFSFWSDLTYRRFGSSKLNFADDTQQNVKEADGVGATIGWFVNQTTSVFGFYDKDEYASYCVGVSKLQKIGDKSFIEGALQCYQWAQFIKKWIMIGLEIS